MSKIFLTTFLVYPCFHCHPKHWCPGFKELDLVPPDKQFKPSCWLPRSCKLKLNLSLERQFPIGRKKTVGQTGRPFLSSLHKRTLFSRWFTRSCYIMLFLFLLRLISSLAAEAGHLHSLTDKKADPNSRSCFVSVLVLYFLFNGVELLHCGCAWGSSTSPELHLCTSTWSYDLASDEISVLRLDMKGRFKDCKKKKITQNGEDSQDLTCGYWKHWDGR